MKKSIIIAIAAFLLVGAPVSAMSESDLEAKLTASYTINGATFKANDEQITLIKRYFAQNSVSEKDCDYIAKEFDKLIQIVDDSNVTSIGELSQTYKNKVSAIASEISKNTSVKVSLSSNGTVTVYNTDGSKFTSVGSSIKNTGALEIMYVAGAISAVGALYFANKARKANN